MKVRLLPAAVRDLREAVAYIALNDPAAAASVSRRIERAVELIAARPDIGRPIDPPGTREWSVPGIPYVIPYRLNGEALEIIRIWHTRRQRLEKWQ